MLKAKDIMQTKVITAHKNSSVKEVMDVLTTNKISGLFIVDDQNCIEGVISEKDILKTYRESNNLNEMKSSAISNICNNKIYAYQPEEDIINLVYAFIEKKIRRVPILDEENIIVGVVSRYDILSFILKIRKKLN